MTSIRAWLVRQSLPALRMTVQPERRSVRAMRVGMEGFLSRFPKPSPFIETHFSLTNLAGRMIHSHASAFPQVGILYFHGGGYAMGSSRTHRFLAARLSERLGVPVFLPDYRLAPEHPFPAAVEDAVLAWQQIPAAYPHLTHWLIGGDSAGGGLALALLQEIRRLGLCSPIGTFLFSPWADLYSGHAAHKKLEKKDPYLDVPIIRSWGIQYAGEHIGHPLASVIGGTYTQAGPILLQVGTHEILYQDACMLRDVLEHTVGVELQFSPWKGMFHGFQMCEGFFPEAGKALDEFAVWARQVIQKSVS